MMYSFVAVSALFCTSIITGNAALEYVHLSTVTMLKTLAPVVQMLTSFLIEKKIYSTKALSCVPLVVLGSLMTSLNAPDFHELGYILVAVALFSTAVYNSLCAILLQEFKLKSTDTWVMNSVFGMIFMFPLFCLLELSEFMALEMDSFELFWKLTLNTVIAVAFCVLNFEVIKVTSSVYNVMLCVIKLVLIVAVSVYLNPIEIPSHRIVGFLIGTMGFFLFSWVTRRPSKASDFNATSEESKVLVDSKSKEDA